MIAVKKYYKPKFLDLHGEFCQVCGKTLTDEERYSIKNFHFIYVCKKHQQYADKRTFKMVRIPCKIKKQLRKKYPGYAFRKGFICSEFRNKENTHIIKISFKSVLDKIKEFRTENGRIPKIYN